MCKEYNGYTNYETWAVSLWMSNDEGSYLHYRELARELLDQNDSDKDAAILDMERAIKDNHEESNPLAGQANVYSDLINAALGSVNWYEIAEHQFEDLGDD